MTNNHSIWNDLVHAQLTAAAGKASSMWHYDRMLDHLTSLPTLENVVIPHWKIFPIVGKSPEEIFWYRLSRGIFNVNLRLRSEDELAYLEEPDLFHDFFGHVPFLFDEDYSNYLRALGTIYQYSDKGERITKWLSNLYWFTAEFGLIVERGLRDTPKVLGAGILSSQDELKYATFELKDDVDIIPPIVKSFNIEEVINLPSYVTNGFQEQYYVLPGKESFRDIIKFLWNNIDKV